MKHIVLETSSWKWSDEPFPRYVNELSFGRNKHDRKFIPSKVRPYMAYMVKGSDFEDTEVFEVKADADSRRDALAESADRRWLNVVMSGSLELPEGKFQIIKTKEKGTIMIVPGKDKSLDLLLFCGIKAGFRGSCGHFARYTTGSVLSHCHAGAACEEESQIAVALQPGENITLWSSGRYGSEVVVHENKSGEVVTTNYTEEEWDAKIDIEGPTEPWAKPDVQECIEALRKELIYGSSVNTLLENLIQAFGSDPAVKDDSKTLLNDIVREHTRGNNDTNTRS